MRFQILLIMIVAILTVTGCNERMNRGTATGFNPQLASDLGADDYGMRRYVVAFLYRGENRNRSQEEAEKLQRAHLDNINRLAQNGLLVVAGPFLDQGELRGIYIFKVETVDEAQKLTETDPAVKAGSLRMELHPWYGSAALLKVNEIHNQIAKTAI
ncbi:MAG: hypothetical protein JXQ65_04765 [Candidatus Marinimicrobia bacterium]|nr:hypothetical protein [Candidatus Neomarinimicrobiota bacterium]